MNTDKVIYTIGHSTRTLEEFLSLLKTFDIQILLDIRSFPVSKRYPHFNSAALSASLKDKDIQYVHLPELGGRRDLAKGVDESFSRQASLAAFADYMRTHDFFEGITKLTWLAEKYRTVYMCSEASWRRCHRAQVSDYLAGQHWKVLHILGETKVEEHPYTPPPKVIQGSLF